MSLVGLTEVLVCLGRYCDMHGVFLAPLLHRSGTSFPAGLHYQRLGDPLPPSLQWGELSYWSPLTTAGRLAPSPRGVCVVIFLLVSFTNKLEISASNLGGVRNASLLLLLLTSSSSSSLPYLRAQDSQTTREHHDAISIFGYLYRRVYHHRISVARKNVFRVYSRVSAKKVFRVYSRVSAKIVFRVYIDYSGYFAYIPIPGFAQNPK